MKAQRGRRGIAAPFNLGARLGGGVSAMPLPLYPWKRDPVPILEETGWALGAGLNGYEKSRPAPGIQPRTHIEGRFASIRTRVKNPIGAPHTQCPLKFSFTNLAEILIKGNEMYVGMLLADRFSPNVSQIYDVL
jgi:hypothetical protein